jgi:glycosyltransferase involved in cell wall biosynthesis
MITPHIQDHTGGTSAATGRVSVIMPCYNGERFIADAIRSFLAQTYANKELIVVDDGSTDRSAEIVAGFGNAVKLISQPNEGPSAARNRGLHAAKGEFIAFLDADDWWAPNFLEAMVSALAGSDAVLAYCGWQNVLADGSTRPPFVPPDYETPDKRVNLLSNASLWPIHGMLTRRADLLALGGFDERLLMCEDYDLWLRLTFTRPIVRVAQVLAYYRHHKPLADSDKRGRDAQWLRRIKKTFIANHPDKVADIPREVLRDCVDGGFMRRGYQCYWNRELRSARRIFRTAFIEGAFAFKDLRYVLPALLPEAVYLSLIARADRRHDVPGGPR